MIRTSIAYAAICGLFGLALPLHGAVLFSDTFNRPDNTSISASAAGMSGTLAPLTYVESYEGSGSPTSIQIASNRLQMAVGAGMSNAFLDYNLIDAAIVEAGGFSISLDIVEINSVTADAANRFMGFGVGMTRNEALAAGDINDDTTAYRGGGGAAGVCDFFADLAIDGQIRLWQNGTLAKTIAVGSTAGTLRVAFSVWTFEAGAAATATVFFNGTMIDQLAFTWSHNAANYIGLSGRASTAVTTDNLVIETVTQLPPAVIIAETDGQTIVKEGGFTDQIIVSLTASPLVFPLTIDIVDVLDPNQVTVSPEQIVFTEVDWYTPRTVTVTAIDDDDMERATHETVLQFIITAQPGSPYDEFGSQELTVRVIDNDCGAWGFNPADFNLDCQVNLEDFVYFVQEWISCSVPDPQCQDYRY